ncbi:sensor histidine kinase [Streptomyces pinistramenti]|uniref:sensor histidine kinase n=1 Tax=Streptomyces pinistramenti TaxID=2884812 RepID=UPI001D06ECE4|nr:histidine kinase [Streptomyces pinistramenti]MCB5910881.1 histidine kinase [Streptomyces pinistramenti]
MRARLPAPPARPHRDDVLIAAAGLLGGLLLWVLGLHSAPPVSGLPSWLTLVALAAISGAELLRRTAPLTGLAIAVAALTLDTCAGTLIATVVMFTDLVYAAVLYGGSRAARRIPQCAVLVTVLTTVVLLAVRRDPEMLMFGIVIGVITATPAWTGLIIRNHRDAAQAARLRAEQTALLAEMDRTQAVAGERARMARELHDMVANHLSAIAIHATAAQTIDDPGATRQALGVIRENSVQGLAEMRRLIGLLRDAAGAEEPAAVPTLDGLEALLGQARTNGAASGLTFTLDDTRHADGTDPRAALPAPVELAAYRIVQESLTNALKHAAPGEVAVRLEQARGGPLGIAVISPFGGRSGPRAPGSGAGLVGMRERTTLLGGTFEAGPVRGPAGTVWQVRAQLPAAEEKTPS